MQQEKVMGLSIESMKAQLGELAPTDRAELAYFLLTTLGPESEEPEEGFAAEPHRRLEEIESGAGTTRTLEEVMAELERLDPE